MSKMPHEGSDGPKRLGTSNLERLLCLSETSDIIFRLLLPYRKGKNIPPSILIQIWDDEA